MNEIKRARLEAQGWRVGSAAEFLNLTPEEAAVIERDAITRDPEVMHGTPVFRGTRFR